MPVPPEVVGALFPGLAVPLLLILAGRNHRHELLLDLVRLVSDVAPIFVPLVFDAPHELVDDTPRSTLLGESLLTFLVTLIDVPLVRDLLHFAIVADAFPSIGVNFLLFSSPGDVAVLVGEDRCQRKRVE